MNSPIAAEIRLRVRIQPRSSREGFDRLGDGQLRVRVNAAPLDNAANKRLIVLIAAEFRVAKSQVEIVSGTTHRNKHLRIHNARRLPQWFDPTPVQTTARD